MTGNHSDVSRRALLGAGAIAGAAAFTILLGEESPAEAALGAELPGLTYIGIDAQAFWPTKAQDRIYQDITGSQPLSAPDRIWAPLSLPAGSVVKQLSASYVGQPIMEINERLMFSGTPATAPTQVFQKAFPFGPGGAFASTENLSAPVVIRSGHTYTVSAFCSAGVSVLGVQIGYRPPVAGFAASTRANPRIFNSDTQGGPLLVGTARVVSTGGGGNRHAVVNVTARKSNGPGYLACYAGQQSNLPSVSFINGHNSENLVIAPLKSDGTFKLLAFGNATHATVDLVGFLR
jgi:hypothetical protein